jgi:beta propeller repeat protein
MLRGMNSCSFLRGILRAAGLTALALILAVEAACSPIPICTSAGDQYNQTIWGNWVVWQDDRAYATTNGDIYAYNIATGETRSVCIAPGNQMAPAIWGDTVVWMDGRNSSTKYDIYSRNLATGVETPIATSAPNKWLPSIYGNRICYEQQTGTGWDDWDIYSATIGYQPQPICSAAGGQYMSRINGGRVVWKDVRGGTSGWTMYLYNLATQQESSIGGTVSDGGGDIWGDYVVWEDERTLGTTKADIYAYNLSTGLEFPVCVSAGDQWSPSIWGDNIVWMDRRSGNWDVYLYNVKLQEEYPLVVGTGNQRSPRIFENRVVYENDPDNVFTNGNSDIYMVYIPERFFTRRPVRVGLNNRDASDAIMHKASPGFSFVLWGKVHCIDDGSFTVDDGSGRPVTVTSPGCSAVLGEGDIARVEGIFDCTASTPTLVCPISGLKRAALSTER